jgi:hypothetical protein
MSESVYAMLHMAMARVRAKTHASSARRADAFLLDVSDVCKVCRLPHSRPHRSDLFICPNTKRKILMCE